MLILSRRNGETIIIGDDVQVVVIETNINQVKLGVVAPKSIPVHREEIYERINKIKFRKHKKYISANDNSMQERVIP